LDFCYLATGKYGCCANQSAKIWDVAPFYLLSCEAGAVYTGIDGQPINFTSIKTTYQRNFTSLAAPKQLHAKLLALISES
jgi:fructose-1,6-bisphosphatase/inositol monophosphatase family enzyme